MSPLSTEELRQILTPEVLLNTLLVRVPVDRPRRITYEELNVEPDYSCAWDPLIALSELGPENALAIDYMGSGVLHSPEKSDFPKLALGLIILLDQGPRMLFGGISQRYVGGYFDPMAFKLIRQCRALPEHLWPWAQHRWVDEMGYTTHQWLWAQCLFLSPSVHSEQLEYHQWHNAIYRAARAAIKASSDGLDNPYEDALSGELGRDIYALPRVAMGGTPTAEELGRPVNMGDLLYWYDMMVYTHMPIIEEFGRYPSANRARGRVSTDKELAWMEKTSFYGVSEALAASIQEDREKGVWTPLKRV